MPGGCCCQIAFGWLADSYYRRATPYSAAFGPRELPSSAVEVAGQVGNWDCLAEGSLLAVVVNTVALTSAVRFLACFEETSGSAFCSSSGGLLN